LTYLLLDLAVRPLKLKSFTKAIFKAACSSQLDNQKTGNSLMRHLFVLTAIVAATTLAGCGATMANLDVDKLTAVGGTAAKAMSLSDGDITTMSNESCAAMDKSSQVATASNKYTTRLMQVVRNMPSSVNNKTANYKVYITPDINAWAMANGCIRVYSGLMDMMNDDELRGVIGHEVGHVALGHSKAAMQAAYATSAVRGLAAASGSAALAKLSDSQAGELAEKFINAQFSQSQESAADNYSFDVLTERKLDRKGLVSAFQKLSKLSGPSSTGSALMSSHPQSADRAANMQKRIDSGK